MSRVEQSHSQAVCTGRGLRIVVVSNAGVEEEQARQPRADSGEIKHGARLSA